MPHATEDEAMGGMDEEAQIRRFLDNGLGGSGDVDAEFDQREKAEDAVDYEDISDDDDLPEEEEATNALEDADGGEPQGGIYDQVASGGLEGLPGQSGTHGYQEPHENGADLFGDSDMGNDLFGDRTSSPEEERHVPATHHVGGLALPSKTTLALPTQNETYQQTRTSSEQMQSSMSPPSYQDRDYAAMSPTSMTSDDDMEDVDPQVALQRRLFNASRKRTAGEDSLDPTETDMGTFYQLYPDYEDTHAPRFIELFPPRNVEYKGKLPLKPPKVLLPTKLSLDLLPDQERNFKAAIAGNRAAQESSYNSSFVPLGLGVDADEESDVDLVPSDFDENEMLGNVSMHDLALICQDWDAQSVSSVSSGPGAFDAVERGSGDGGWDAEESARPTKKRKTDVLQSDVAMSLRAMEVSFTDPERTTAKLAKSVALDLNDPHLLIDEHAPRTKKLLPRIAGDIKRDSALNRDIAKRYNISNDQAYDLLKENHQHKVRSTLGSMAVEHSFPAVKLQYPFYKITLDAKAKRAFHRPHLELKNGNREYRFQKQKTIKKKHVRGRDAKDVFAKAEDLSLGDSASILLLEYSEEAPMMLSNFGMGNRLINYYRKQHADDQNRGEKKEIGEAQVLLTQDKSPFSNFGHVDKGETVPTIQNGLYRAPVFAHQPKHTDFIIGISSTYENGDRFFLRNVENLHTVGQQFPLAEVPGQHSRKVTDAAKKRLRALSYRIYTKSLTRKDKILDNASLMPHLPGHDMPQTRSKMREFMKYERVTNRGDGSTGVWVPQPGQAVPDADTLRSWIRPEDVCLLDSMQVGVQHLTDLGINEGKEADEDKDIDEGANIELQLAPWRATKNFLNACQGKAMLKLHGDGDPTGQGLGFSFVKTSMKGGFQAQGESVEDRIDKQRRRDHGGHSYNVAKQQKQYDESIRRIWESQRVSLQTTEEISDDEMEEPDRSAEYDGGRVHTPRSSFSTPAAFTSRHDDDYMSQFSGHSNGRGDKTLVITRSGGLDSYGQPLPEVKEIITNPAVIREYRKRSLQKEFANAEYVIVCAANHPPRVSVGATCKTDSETLTLRDRIGNFVPTGDPEKDEFARQQLQKELTRVLRNAERREAREKLKEKKMQATHSPSAAPSPGPSDLDGPASTIAGPSAGPGLGAAADNAPQKSKGRSKDGTARKCANCGQVGHIKTNRKSVIFHCLFCSLRDVTVREEKEDAKEGVGEKEKEGVSHGRRTAAKRTAANGGRVPSTTFFRDSYSRFEL
jgi:transcription initiation factor TFIID subunit 1